MSDVISDAAFEVAGVPLKKVQQRAFQVLCALVGFLESENIGYFLIGGTLLGAVRHQGFIPWDDDIDIGIHRPDYQRLLQALSRMPASLRAAHPTIDPMTPYPFLVVSDAYSSLVIDYAKPYGRGIGVDVFPLDGLPSSRLGQVALASGIGLLRAMTMNKQGGYYQRRVGWRQRLRLWSLGLLTALVPRRLLFRAYDAWVSSVNIGDAGLIGNLYGLYGRREWVSREVLGLGCEVEFCGCRFRAPAEPENYLHAVYGEFLRLPDADQRHSGHRIRTVSLE